MSLHVEVRHGAARDAHGHPRSGAGLETHLGEARELLRRHRDRCGPAAGIHLHDGGSRALARVAHRHGRLAGVGSVAGRDHEILVRPVGVAEAMPERIRGGEPVRIEPAVADEDALVVEHLPAHTRVGAGIGGGSLVEGLREGDRQTSGRLRGAGQHPRQGVALRLAGVPRLQQSGRLPAPATHIDRRPGHQHDDGARVRRDHGPDQVVLAAGQVEARAVVGLGLVGAHDHDRHVGGRRDLRGVDDGRREDPCRRHPAEPQLRAEQEALRRVVRRVLQPQPVGVPGAQAHRRPRRRGRRPRIRLRPSRTAPPPPTHRRRRSPRPDPARRQRRRRRERATIRPSSENE